MNKTININLGGFFFHIDELAYQILKEYLESITRSLSDEPKGKNEIIGDIEARISELLSQKTQDLRQVINESDINNIITIMGQPEDYKDNANDYSNDKKLFGQRKKNTNKLYRDADNKLLGGVASGIGYYIGIGPVWVRLSFILLTLFGGFGIPIYLVLWILIPEAKTTAEKLKMEGESVNIENIEKKFRAEFNNFGDKIKNANYGKEKTVFHNFLNTLGKIIREIFKVISKCIGVLLMFVAAVILLLLVIGAFSIGSLEFLGMSKLFTSSTSFISSSLIPYWTAAIVIFIAIGFPFLILFLLGLRIVSSSIQPLSKTSSLALLGIWIISLLALGFNEIEHQTAKAIIGSKIYEEPFLYKEIDTLHIKMINDDDLIYKDILRRMDEQEFVYDEDTRKTYCNNITVDLIYNDTNAATIKITRISEGKNRNIANKNAAKIEYNYSINHRKIELNGYFLSPESSLNKNENIAVIISVPLNTRIYFTKSTMSFLGDIETTQDISNNDMPKHNFTMKQVGLECTDCDERLYRN